MRLLLKGWDNCRASFLLCRRAHRVWNFFSPSLSRLLNSFLRSQPLQSFSLFLMYNRLPSFLCPIIFGQQLSTGFGMLVMCIRSDFLSCPPDKKLLIWLRRMSPFAFNILLGMKLGIFGHPIVFCAPSTVWIILAEFSRARSARSGPPWVRKYGNLRFQEILVLRKSYARPPLHV